MGELPLRVRDLRWQPIPIPTKHHRDATLLRHVSTADALTLTGEEVNNVKVPQKISLWSVFVYV